MISADDTVQLKAAVERNRDGEIPMPQSDHSWTLSVPT